MRTENEIKTRIGILDKSMKKYLKQMEKKQKINKNSIDKQEELEELYYECLIETITLKWVLGTQ